MRLGLVDLDTSHPQNWVPIERELGHEVVGVWDAGTVHPEGYAERFAAEHRIERVFGSLEEMVEAVDGAVIHGCDWGSHQSKARPFIEAGKAVLIDKPIAGKLDDLRVMGEWVRSGARITGGSSLRFCAETEEWLSQPVAERGTPHTVLCGCAVDEFNYGIHAYAMLAGILGAGARSVRHLGQGLQRRIEIRWEDGRVGIVIVGKAAGWIPFYTSIVTERGVHQFRADNGKLYRALLAKTLPYLSGEVDEAPVPFSSLIEPELWALAARRSWTENDREVLLSDLSPDEGYDGAAFAQEYRRARYPG